MASNQITRADASPAPQPPAPPEPFARCEAHYQLLFERAPEPYFVVDLQGIILDVNRAGEAILACDRGDLIGRSYLEIELLPSDQAPIATNMLAQNALGKPAGPTELRLRRKDGTEVHLEIASYPVESGGRTLVLANARDITARKQADARLRRSEANFRLAQRIGHIGSWETDFAAHTLEWSEETYRIFGCRPEEFTPSGEGFFGLVHPEDRERVREAVHTSRRLKQPYAIEHRIIRPDGSERVVSEQADLVLDEQGQPARFVGVVQDITERKKLADRLLESEEHYRRLIVTSPDGIALTDAQARITYCSPRLHQLFGAPPDLPTDGQSVLEWVAPEHRELATTAIRSLLASKQPGTPKEFRMLRHDHTPFWGEICSTPLLDAQGEVRGMMSIIRDITQRKQVEARLAEQAALLESANDALLVLDLSHQIRYWNQGAQRLYGWSAAEAVGRPAATLLYSDFSRFDHACHQVLERGDWTGEAGHLTRGGKPVTVLSRWTLVRDERGQPKSIFLINTDLTEHKKLEAQFLRAQRLESIGQLASGIAHDLNNILVPITLVTPILRDHVTSPELLGLLETVESSAQRGASIVKQVLTFSRGMRSEKSELHPRQLLEEVASIMREAFPRSIAIKTAWPAGLWVISGDQTQLHQVLMNLCVNARDAMPDGGALTLSAENVVVDESFASQVPDAKAGPHVVLLVADTGVGIKPEHMDQIFDPFFTTKEVGQGTGLGLATVLGIVRNHEGFMRVDTKPGRGTQFRVYLPALPQGQVPDLPGPARAIPAGNGELILVVDDEESIRTVTQHILERHNYQVLLASEGAEAVMLLTQHLRDVRLVVTDLMMPQMSGLTLIRILKKLSPGVGVMVATGLETSPELNSLAQLGVTNVLRKPFSSVTLLEQLRLELDRVA